MFDSLKAAAKIIHFMIKQNKLKNLAKKYDAEGNIVERDKVVNGIVPVWARYCFEATNSTVEVVGLEKIPSDRAVVFIGNHQGYMDIPALFGYLNKPMTFVAKAELAKIPLLSDWMKLLQCTFIVRNNTRKSIQAIKDAAAGVGKGYSQVIFPEGHRSKGGPHMEFKPGSFKLAFLSKAPIVPFTIEGTYKIFEEKGRLSLGQHVKIMVHDPIETENLSRAEQGEIPARVEKIVCEQLER